MTLPAVFVDNLEKSAYGLTRTEAIVRGVCINCKIPAQSGVNIHSPAGAAEYRISGMCEDCFDALFTEEEEDMEIKGSDVEGTINNDHALAAQKTLDDNGYAKEWQVVVADDKILMLDYDQRPYDGGLPEHFYDALAILEQALHETQCFTVHESKGGNTHALVRCTVPMDIYERIAWQAAFGSDPKREALHLLSVSRNELNPILLFMRKDRQTSGVDDKGNNIVQCSHYDVATPEKLLAAGVPQLLLGE